MGLINTKPIICLPKQIGHWLGSRQNIANLVDLQYLPKELTTDVLELSRDTLKTDSIQKTIEAFVKSGKSLTQIAKELNISTPGIVYHLKKMGIYKPTKVGNTPDTIIDKNILESLINAKKSVSEIATELNVPVGKVRYYLNKYGIRNSDLEELEILRKYFSATTQKDKTEVYAIIDKYLEQIAKEKYHEGCAISYQDFLQDIRLHFFELAYRRENSANTSVRNLFRRIREFDFTQNVEHKTENLTSILNKADYVNVSIENFENAEFFKFLLKNSNLTGREEHIINAYTKENGSLVNIAYELGLEPQRVKEILNNAIKKLDKARAFFSSDRYLKLKSQKAQHFVRELAKQDKNSRNVNAGTNYNINFER